MESRDPAGKKTVGELWFDHHAKIVSPGGYGAEGSIVSCLAPILRGKDRYKANCPPRSRYPRCDERRVDALRRN